MMTKGLLVGYSTILVYVVAGIPASLYADQFSRKAFVVVGMLLWSLCTMWQGLARTFAELVIARLIVGAAEESLYQFKKKKRKEKKRKRKKKNTASLLTNIYIYIQFVCPVFFFFVGISFPHFFFSSLLPFFFVFLFFIFIIIILLCTSFFFSSLFLFR